MFENIFDYNPVFQKTTGLTALMLNACIESLNPDVVARKKVELLSSKFKFKFTLNNGVSKFTLTSAIYVSMLNKM